MAARRKSQARRGSDRRVPVWVWFLGGVLMGLAMCAALLIWDREGRLPVPRANPTATASKPSDPGVVPPPTPSAAAEKPKARYDFYTLLRESETQVSDKELAAKVKEEAQTTPSQEQEKVPVEAKERYLLQAGAFRDLRDADAVKARIAFSGLQARVETVQINGAAVHRVRLGPYATARELEDAKRQLANNGVTDTVAVREAIN